MNVFWRYFIHSILITASLSLAIIVIALISPEMELSLPIIIIIMFLVGCLYFSFGMALVCNERSEIITLIVKKDNNTINEIEKIITEKTLRKDIVRKNDLITHYRSKSKYLKWLTNDIVIEEADQYAKLKVPREYVKLFNIYLYE